VTTGGVAGAGVRADPAMHRHVDGRAAGGR
jgi:hypothetical protein